MMRSVTQDVTPAMMRRTRGGVSTWWSRHGSTATLSVLAWTPIASATSTSCGSRSWMRAPDGV
jgi:hypothetical protein